MRHSELDDQSRVRRFVEKPNADQVFSRLANAGVLVVEPSVLSWLPDDCPVDFGHDVFPQMLATDQTIVGYPIEDSLIDIGTPQNYRKAQELAARFDAERSATTRITGLLSSICSVFDRRVLTQTDALTTAVDAQD